MTHRRPPAQPPRDPLNTAGRGGQIGYKDYTKYVQWTPRKIAMFTIALALPYLGAAIAVGWATAPYIGILMLAIPGILALLGAGFYWLLRNAG